MKYTIVDMPERSIIGPTITTGNNDPEVSQKIGGLWQEFMQNGMAESIPSPVLEPYTCFGTYYNYDFDTMTYTMQVGCESGADEVPAGMERILLPAGRYAKFEVKGDIVQAVIDAWNAIWSLEELMAQRANTYDYEAYLPGDDMQNAEVEIYVALR